MTQSISAGNIRLSWPVSVVRMLVCLLQSKEEELPGLEVVKPVKEDFANDWATATDVNVPQTEVADVRLPLCHH